MRTASQARRDPPNNPPLGERAVIKFDVPRELWQELRIEAVKRDVTIKYLMMEMLHRAGYPVNMNEVSEDGRRDR